MTSAPFDGGPMSAAEHLEAAVHAIAAASDLPVHDLVIVVKFGEDLRVRRVAITHWSWPKPLILGRRQLDVQHSDAA